MQVMTLVKVHKEQNHLLIKMITNLLTFFFLFIFFCFLLGFVCFSPRFFLSSFSLPLNTLMMDAIVWRKRCIFKNDIFNICRTAKLCSSAMWTGKRVKKWRSERGESVVHLLSKVEYSRANMVINFRNIAIPPAAFAYNFIVSLHFSASP